MENNMKAVVTGASTGMGKEYAYELAQRGYNLVLVARSQNLLLDIKKDIEKSYGVKVECIKADLSVSEEVEKVNKEFLKNSKDLKIFINNAGFGLFGNFLKRTEKEITEMTNLNMRTLALFTNSVGNAMAKNGGGIIINISSVANIVHAFPNNGLYSATKCFVDAFSQAVNFENKKLGNNVRVVSVRPGLIKTNFYMRSSKNNPKAFTPDKLKGFTPPEKIAKRVIRKALAGKNIINYGKNFTSSRIMKLITPKPFFYGALYNFGKNYS